MEKNKDEAILYLFNAAQLAIDAMHNGQTTCPLAEKWLYRAKEILILENKQQNDPFFMTEDESLANQI